MANFNFNKVILGGRLTADPELKKTQGGISVTTFSVAVNRRGKDAVTDFITVTAWRGVAENVVQYLRKGSCVCVEGEIHNRKWTDPQGNKRYATEVDADSVIFVDSKKETGSPASASGTEPAPTTNFQPEFRELGDDEELPF